MEDFYLGHATERIFLPLLKLTIPEIVDYHMPAEGIFHNLVFVSIKKEYPGQAYKVMNAMWGQGLMSLAKVLVVVDEWVNVRDPQEAWWVALNNIDPERDARFTMGPVDVLDHSSRAFTYGSKMGLDATQKLPEEGFARELAGGDRDGRRDEATRGRAVADARPRRGRETPCAGAARRAKGRRSRGAVARWSRYVNFVKLPHTVFALPFALVGVVLASYRAPVTSATLGWVVLAFTAARFAAMGFNRIVDREYRRAEPAHAPCARFRAARCSVREAKALVIAACCCSSSRRGS